MEGVVVSALVSQFILFPEVKNAVLLPVIALLFSRNVLLFLRSAFLVNMCIFQDCFFQVIVLSICPAQSSSER